MAMPSQYIPTNACSWVNPLVNASHDLPPLRLRKTRSLPSGGHGVQTKSAGAGMPFGPGRMLRKTGDFIPGLAAVLAAEERRRGHTGIEHLWLAGPARLDMPNALHLQSRIFRKGWILFGG